MRAGSKGGLRRDDCSCPLYSPKTKTYHKLGESVAKAAGQLLSRLKMGTEQMDLIEIQEAFAAQVLADLKEMNLGPDDYPRINVNGSGISLGHPISHGPLGISVDCS